MNTIWSVAITIIWMTIGEISLGVDGLWTCAFPSGLPAHALAFPPGFSSFSAVIKEDECASHLDSSPNLHQILTRGKKKTKKQRIDLQEQHMRLLWVKNKVIKKLISQLATIRKIFSLTQPKMPSLSFTGASCHPFCRIYCQDQQLVTPLFSGCAILCENRLQLIMLHAQTAIISLFIT